MSRLSFCLLPVITPVSDNNNPYTTGKPQSTVKNSLKPFVKGVKNVDVVNAHGSIEGLERMQKFYEDIQNVVPADLRIVHYTIEGDPIVTDLTYNGESLEVKLDTTRTTMEVEK